MSKLNQEELLRQVEMWLLGCTHDTEIPYEGCKKCPSKKSCKQTHQQIKEMIQKPEVTEEWIEEKAIELNNEILLANYKESYYNMSKDFIRKLIEEIEK